MRADFRALLATRHGWEVSRGLNRIDRQIIVSFPNGYAASIIRDRFWPGGRAGLFELAVHDAGGVCYDTPITSDVLRDLTQEETVTICERIAALPPRTQPKEPTT